MPIFDEKNISEITAEDLVGEGKKFRTMDDMARGKAESDRVIADRNRELQELRDELNKRLTAEELLEKFNTVNRNTPTPSNQSITPPAAPAAPGAVLTDEDLAERVKNVINQTNTEQTKLANQRAVSEKLIEIYGDDDKASAAVRLKAQELGVSLEFLQSVAAQSPKAFYAQVGITDSAPRATPSTHGDVNTAAFAANRPGEAKPSSIKYWEAQRKERGNAWYFSPEVQTALMKEAFANPEGFYS